MPNLKEPPKIASRILQFFTPAEIRNELVGDLHEEYSHRIHQNPKAAAQWYWQQTIRTSCHYVTRFIASETLLRKLVILISLILFPALLVMISWLSVINTASDHIWQNLLAGKVHSFIFEPEVVVNGTDALLQYAEFEMYLNWPSFFWSLFTLFLLVVRNKTSTFTAHQLTAWGTTMMFLPYIFGLVYIDIIDPAPKQVGPTVAFMTLSIVYIILPLTYFIVRKSYKT